jgi:biotin carboxyl carrier protein
MTFEVEINARVRSVSIEALGSAGPGGGRFRVLVDGQASELTARPTDLGLSLIFTADGQAIDAALTERPGGEWLVQLPHVTVTAVVDGRRYQRGPAADESGAGARRVTAPMPGRVVRVLVKPGDEVAVRQGLVVVEAMKMENELGSPKAGRVTEVAVSEGMPIEAGRLLVIVE